MSETEKNFRVVERQLDELLRRDEAVLTARGITIEDRSARAYHYKNETLTWSYRFETRRARRSEIERVSVRLSLWDHEAGVLRVERHAEIFQTGKQSRWNSSTKELLPFAEAARRGLSDIVIEAMSAGEAALAAAI